MGSGIAKQIAHHFPLAKEADLATEKGNRYKLGIYSYAYISEYDLIIINAYIQYRYGWNKVHADMNAIRNIFNNLKQHLSGKRFGLPRIGAGHAKGNWNEISKIIEEELYDEDVTLVNYLKGNL
jgi:O-acetyl-ADP-ribose deacetylase (regulator of RNase III)